MNKVYILVPLIGLLIFGGFFYNFSKNYQASIEARQVVAAAELKAKQQAEIAGREKAYKDAILAQEKRRLERAEKEKREEADKQLQLDLLDKRTRTFDEMKRNRERVDILKKDLAIVQEDIKKLEGERKRNVDEQAFLKTYVKQAEANARYYYDLLDKISAAEAAALEAAKAAAAAAKKG